MTAHNIYTEEGWKAYCAEEDAAYFHRSDLRRFKRCVRSPWAAFVAWLRGVP